MIRHGAAPFLECSSRGDRRFSAFYARLGLYGGRSIEEVYQASKVFEHGVTGLSPAAAKGRKAVNQAELGELYEFLWTQYLRENPSLLAVLRAASGLSDLFGQEGHCCQATTLWHLRNSLDVSGRAKVINIKDAPEGWKSDPQYVYIGRRGHGLDGYFGNPLGKLEGYEEWLITRLQYDLNFLNAVKALKGKTLVCFCKPKPCHGDILAIFADNMGEL